MAKQINLNADMGEGFGAYDIGDDAGLLKIIRSASIACGFSMAVLSFLNAAGSTR